ncbi:MAG TPA: FG-GAP-like repeat-containing protein [Terriglobales bacterium]
MNRFFRSLLPILIFLFPVLSDSAQNKPDRAEAVRLTNIGVALMNQQVMEKAVEKFNQALQKDPTLSTAELDKGIALLNLQKLNEAEQALMNAAKAEPKNPRVWFNLGLLHRNQGKNEAAVEDFKKVLALDPTDPDSHYLLGSFYQQLQQYDLAIPQFEDALKLNPLHASAEFGLARSLQRSGKIEEARVHLKKFEHLTREKISSPMTLGYGEQGRYSSAQDITTGQPSVGAMIPVTFVNEEIGAGKHNFKAIPEGNLGGGACLLDVNGDNHPDLLEMRDGEPAVQVLLRDGKGGFKESSAQPFGLELKGRAVSCAVGDFDNDGVADLVIAMQDRIVLFKNDGHGKFADVTKAAAITSANDPAGLTFVDFDHDGDLDLVITGKKAAGGANVVWRNNGNGTFTEWTAQTGIADQGATVGAVLSDVNNDRAVDLVVTGSTSAPLIYANQREGKFKASPVYAEALPPTVGIVLLDFNKDGWMDVALTHSGKPGISLWKNIEGKRFERVPLPGEDARQGWGISAVDFDNDGWVDLAAVVETSRGTEVRLLRNVGERGFADVTKDVGLNKLKLQDARSVIASDVDGDGDADLIVTQLNGPAEILRNDGGNKNHSLRLSFAGLADNKSGIGTKVEVFADGLWQKWEVAGAGYLGQGTNDVLVGLGPHERVDIVRMLWPTGVLQDELEVALDKPISFTELDRRGSSCPTLFAWNGTKYEFVSDVIGAAVIGHWISPTERNIADPDEWVKIDGSQLKAKNGKFSLRFGEPMEEVNYVDQVKLIAVDHPAGTDVYPNERFLSAPPFPDGKAVLTSAPHLPVGAWDNDGRNVLGLLSKRDHQYVRDFKNSRSFVGYANMHSLTLDLGRWSKDQPLRMYMQGFIEYFTATSMYAAWQAGIDPVAPYVEAQLPDGSWKRVIDDMGFPAGLPRMIVVDLTGKLPEGTRRIRIKTNLQIYWDQVLVDNGPQRSDFKTTALPLVGSSLAFRGYPKQIDGKTSGDLTYDYQQVSQTGPFSRQTGTYTRYGDVTPLLQRVDDHYVIFGSGEDIDLEFSPTTLPPLPVGWKRDYFFYANGYVKDMDFYEALPFTVAELPFRKMSRYPYPNSEHYPEDPASLQYRLEWNDRFDSGKGGPGYGFHYVPRRP